MARAGDDPDGGGGEAPAVPGPLRVEVIHCPAPQVADVVALDLPAGSTLADALRASGLPARHALSPDGLRCGIWGRVRDVATPLRDGDRVEVYRPLQVDPMEARRQRQRQQRETAPGSGRAKR